jgi:hypothetical protein
MRALHHRRATIREGLILGVVVLLGWSGIGAASTAARPRALTVAGESLTVRATHVPVASLLDELQSTTGAEIVLIDADVERRITVEFVGVPVAAALERVLRGSSFMLEFSSSANGSRLSRLTVMGPGKGGATGALRPAVTSGPHTGGAAAPAVLERGTRSLEGDTVLTTEQVGLLTLAPDKEEAIVTLGTMLANQSDAHLRDAVFTGLEELGSGLPPLDATLSIAHEDPAPELRMKALGFLHRYSAREPRAEAAVAWLALHDPDPQVREFASAIAESVHP